MDTNFSQRSAIILVIVAVSMTFVTSDGDLTQEEYNIKMPSNKTNFNDLMRNETLYSTSCNHNFQKIIDQNTRNFEAKIKICKQDSENERLKTEAATLSNRNYLAAITGITCMLLSQCKQMDTVEEIFDCYIEMGMENIEIINEIKTDASKYLSTLREKLREVKNVEYRCTNETKLIYDKIRLEAYANFTTCMVVNNVPVIQTSKTKPTEEPDVNINQPGVPNEVNFDADFENRKSYERMNSTEAISPESTDIMNGSEATTNPTIYPKASKSSSEGPESMEGINSTETTTSSTVASASKSLKDPISSERINSTEATIRSTLDETSTSLEDPEITEVITSTVTTLKSILDKGSNSPESPKNTEEMTNTEATASPNIAQGSEILDVLEESDRINNTVAIKSQAPVTEILETTETNISLEVTTIPSISAVSESMEEISHIEATISPVMTQVYKSLESTESNQEATTSQTTDQASEGSEDIENFENNTDFTVNQTIAYALENLKDSGNFVKINNTEAITTRALSESNESTKEITISEATTSQTTAQALEKSEDIESSKKINSTDSMLVTISEILEDSERINRTEVTTSTTISQVSKIPESTEDTKEMTNMEASTILNTF